jgi:cell division protease FtsH
MQEKEPKNFRPNLSGDDKGSKKGPKFSIYWVYAIIAVILLSNLVFNVGRPETLSITSLVFKTEMLPRAMYKKLILLTMLAEKV